MFDLFGYKKLRAENEALRVEVLQLRIMLETGFKEFGIVLSVHKGQAVSARNPIITFHKEQQHED